MRIVGNQNLETDQVHPTPEQVWWRGRVLDAMLPNAVQISLGVSRLTHAQRNAQDDARMVGVARRLNSPAPAHDATRPYPGGRCAS